MKRINGWEVYLKIKQMSGGESELHINAVMSDMGITKELAQEYLAALSVLQFIRFKDESKEWFEMIDLARG